jgi:4-amino-4-deoxy-L-arabinose transferase-like glycosyltransferase
MMRITAGLLFLILSCLTLLALAFPLAIHTYPAYDEGWLMSKAYNFLHHGKMAFTGMGHYLNFDSHTFTEMPLRSVITSLFFFLFGTGILQARIVSIVMSGAILLLSYKLSRELFDKTTAAVTVFLLLFLRLGLMNDVSGIALLDMAPSARYDIDQALWALLSVLFFIKGNKNENSSPYILAGFFAALAVLSHLYACVLPFSYLLFFLFSAKPSSKAMASVFLAFLLTLSPYLVWVLAHFEDYKNQMTWYFDRGNYLSADYYLQNIKTEINRYTTPLAEGGSYMKYLLLPALLFAVFFLLKEYRKNKPSGALKLLAILLISTAVLFLFFENIKLPLYFSLAFPFLTLSMAAILVKTYELPGLVRKTGVAVLLVYILWDGIHGIGLKYEKTFEKENAALTAEFLHQHIPKNASVITFSHFWPALRENEPLDFVRVGFEFRRNKMTGINDSTNLQNILDEIHPDYLVIFGGFDDWMRFFSRPYYDSFSKAWEQQLKSNFQPVANRYSNIYGEVVIYRTR